MHTLTTLAAAVVLAVAPTPDPTPIPEAPHGGSYQLTYHHTELPSCEAPTTLVGDVTYRIPYVWSEEAGQYVDGVWELVEDARVEVSLTAAQEVECFPEPEPEPVPAPEPVAPVESAEVGTASFAEKVAEANPGAPVVRVELG